MMRLGVTTNSDPSPDPNPTPNPDPNPNEVGRNKHFSVKLDAAEGGTLDAWWGRVRLRLRLS